MLVLKKKPVAVISIILVCCFWFYNVCKIHMQFSKQFLSFWNSLKRSFIFFTERQMTNVASFKLVSMSSEWNPPHHSPSYAVDDQVLNTVNGAKCACTQNDLTPWMVIDLENTFNVNYITLFNRIDTLGNIFLLYSKASLVLTHFGICFSNLRHRMAFRYHMTGYVCESESGCTFGLKIKYLFLR